MNKKQHLKPKHFGANLEELMIFTGVKNTLIASELNYDTSYISKWITGKSLPSKKNIEKILSTICDVLVAHSNENILSDLLVRFNAKNKTELKEFISSYLRNSYFDTSGEIEPDRLRGVPGRLDERQGLHPDDGGVRLAQRSR